MKSATDITLKRSSIMCNNVQHVLWQVHVFMDKNCLQLRKLLTTIVLPYESVYIFLLNLLINLTCFPFINALFVFLLLVLGINVSMFHVSANNAICKICVTHNSKCTVNVHWKVYEVVLVNVVHVTTTPYNHTLPIQPLSMLLCVSPLSAAHIKLSFASAVVEFNSYLALPHFCDALVSVKFVMSCLYGVSTHNCFYKCHYHI